MSMAKKHVQAHLEPHEYDALQRAAQKEKLTLKEAVREAALDWARRKGAGSDPLHAIVGIAKGRRDASTKHDEDYLED
jgi:hypothetical protein